MATNLIKDNGDVLAVVVSDPAAPDSGDPCRFGVLVGVALADEGDGNVPGSTYTVVDFGKRVWDLLVDDNGGSGIAVGAQLYYHDTATGSPASHINNSSSGADAYVGIALEAVAANDTDTINVLVTPTT